MSINRDTFSYLTYLLLNYLNFNSTKCKVITGYFLLSAITNIDKILVSLNRKIVSFTYTSNNDFG